MKENNKLIIIFLSIIIIYLTMIIVSSFISLAKEKYNFYNNDPNKVKIYAFNSSRYFNLKAEIKCDFQPELKRYKFYKIYDLKADSHMEVLVSKEYKVCEIWPFF